MHGMVGAAHGTPRAANRITSQRSSYAPSSPRASPSCQGCTYCALPLMPGVQFFSPAALPSFFRKTMDEGPYGDHPGNTFGTRVYSFPPCAPPTTWPLIQRCMQATRP